MNILFDVNSTEDQRSVTFSVTSGIELRLWGGHDNDKVKIYALLVDTSNPQFQLQGCKIYNYQYVATPLAEMEYACFGKPKVLSASERMIYITRPGWYKAVYEGVGIGESIVDFEEGSPCECC